MDLRDIHDVLTQSLKSLILQPDRINATEPWNDIQSKSKAYADNIISSLEQHTLNIEVEEEW